jgi:ubiquinone/menaquinone biosynthesis C-methylase UbiE
MSLSGILTSLRGRKKAAAAPPPSASAPSPPAEVGRFYDAQHGRFLQTYGEVIQAFRTKDVTKLLDYQAESMGLQAGQRVLDAGCGVCGPALYFARKAGVTVEAVTVSATQAEHARRRIAEEKLEGKVTVRQGNYQTLPEMYEADSFDVVYFLESFGHSDDHQKTIEAAWRVLKPGGILYIKDLFAKDPAIEAHAGKIREEIEKINRAYHYNIPDLYRFLSWVRKRGFILLVLKTIDLALEDFENLTISNDFQELTGIGKIQNWAEYIFPVDFFEVKCMKPVHDIRLGNSRYFLQNLYHLKVLQTRTEDL